MTARELTVIEVCGTIGVGTEEDPHRTLTVYFERLPDRTLKEIAQRDSLKELQVITTVVSR